MNSYQQDRKGNNIVHYFSQTPGFQSDCSYYIDIPATNEQTYVSLIARIEDSPDWFIGDSGIDLCNEDDGVWLKQGLINVLI